MGSVRWVWKYIRAYWLNVLIGIVLVIFVALLNSVSPLIGGRIVDDVIVKGKDGLLVPFLIAMILASLVRTILRYVYQILFEQIGQNALFNMREEMYRKLQELDFSYFNNTRVGDIMARMTGDTDAIRHAVSWLFYNVLDNFLLLVSAIVVMGIIEWRLMLALVFITPFIGLLTIVLSHKASPVFYQIRESFSRLNSMVEENISGNKVVKAFAREEYEIKKFNEYNED